MANAEVTVFTRDASFEATAVNESIGGLALHTKSAVALMPGEYVEIVHRDVEMDARVAGDACSAWFFRFRGVTMRCEIAGHPPAEDDPMAPCQIRLWDGKQFDVMAKQIIQRTRDARCMEILTMGPARHVLTQLYGLPSSESPEDVQNILNFEFGGEGFVLAD